MSKPTKKGRKDINQTAFSVVQRATENEVVLNKEDSEKNPSAVTLGRLGGLKGGKARANALSATKRSEIARMAAIARWKKRSVIEGNNMALTWKKSLTDSDAQQETLGAKMPFLRFTRANLSINHTTWFREVFFADLQWRPETSRQGRPIEVTQIDIQVKILGEDLGVRQMRIDHDPARALNNNAPTTHLHYDNKTRLTLESMSLTGHTVSVVNEDGKYSLVVE